MVRSDGLHMAFSNIPWIFRAVGMVGLRWERGRTDGGWCRFGRKGPGFGWENGQPVSFSKRTGIVKPILKVCGWRIYWLHRGGEL